MQSVSLPTITEGLDFFNPDDDVHMDVLQADEQCTDKRLQRVCLDPISAFFMGGSGVPATKPVSATS